MHDAPYHANDILCQIWKEAILNCKFYKADTARGTGGWTDGQIRIEWNQYTTLLNNIVQQRCADVW